MLLCSGLGLRLEAPRYHFRVVLFLHGLVGFRDIANSASQRLPGSVLALAADRRRLVLGRARLTAAVTGSTPSAAAARLRRAAARAAARRRPGAAASAAVTARGGRLRARVHLLPVANARRSVWFQRDSGVRNHDRTGRGSFQIGGSIRRLRFGLIRSKMKYASAGTDLKTAMSSLVVALDSNARRDSTHKTEAKLLRPKLWP